MPYLFRATRLVQLIACSFVPVFIFLCIVVCVCLYVMPVCVCVWIDACFYKIYDDKYYSAFLSKQCAPEFSECVWHWAIDENGQGMTLLEYAQICSNGDALLSCFFQKSAHKSRIIAPLINLLSGMQPSRNHPPV